MSDDLLELEGLLQDLPAAIERRRIGENLGRTAVALQDAPRQIERFKAVIDIARETDFEKETIQAEAMNELLDTANDAANTMTEANTSDQLRNVQDAYKDFIMRLAAVERQLRSQWRRVVTRDFAPLSAIGALLEKIDKTSKLGGKLKACGQKAEQIRDSIPAEALLEAISELRQERSTLEAERKSVTKDPEVDKFLNALAEGDATLRMITERVRNWLEQNGALDNFAIIPRS